MKKIIVKIYSLPILKNETFNQAAKYFIVGGFCTALDFLLLFTLTHFTGRN